MPNFDSSGDISSLGIRWTRWLRSFELYATGQGVRDDDKRKLSCYIVQACKFKIFSIQ